METSADKNTAKAVANKVKETDEKMHAQVQKIKNSKIGKLIPTEYTQISVKKVALISLVLNTVLFLYTYLLFVALFPGETEKEAFHTSFIGICVAIIYTGQLAHDLVVYFFDISSMLLSFWGIRAIALLITLLTTVCYLKGLAANWIMKLFIALTSILASLVHVYVFSMYMSHIKTGGNTNSGDQEQV